VSIKSFIIGLTAIIAGALVGISTPVLLFYSTIVCMQLVEYVVWTNINNKNVIFNASIAAVLLLWLQPIFAMLTMNNYKMISIIAYCIIGLLYSLYDNRKIKLQMYPGNDGHLVWNWLEGNRGLWIYFIFLLTPVFFMVSKEMIALILLTLFASLYGYYTTNTWGSMWCWLVNGLVVLACIKGILKKMI
jgi:uncharacterized membrane protein